MAIPENQLETWSHQGSVTQSASTYATIKRALEAASANYTDRNFEVFLQGSYGNDTNIFTESDVDVVIRYDGAFYHNINRLPADQQRLFKASFPDGPTYSYVTFNGHVQAALRKAFENSVEPGKKAIKIHASGSRRNADVVVAFEYRHYDKFTAPTDQSRGPGIAFFTSSGTHIANYPKQHSKNLTTKHQATSNNFKKVVRIFKNMRGKLVADGLLGKGTAPSYFIEVSSTTFQTTNLLVPTELSFLTSSSGSSKHRIGQHLCVQMSNIICCATTNLFAGRSPTERSLLIQPYSFGTVGRCDDRVTAPGA